MIFQATPLAGAFLLAEEPQRDARGSFSRVFCTREYQDHGLDPRVVQASVSHNRARGTLRGMHYQRAPHGEAKTVRCTRGAIFDVIADLRPGSATLHGWFAIELTADSGRALYVPAGMAHGFLTLCDDSVVEYLISEFHVPEASAGVRYDDPTLGIRWPFSPVVISDRDAALPGLREG